MSAEITIKLTEYNRLLLAQMELEALDNNGVDNWEGYSDAIREYHEAGVAAGLIEED